MKKQKNVWRFNYSGYDPQWQLTPTWSYKYVKKK